MNPKIEGNFLKNNYEIVFDGIFIWIFVVIFVVIFEKIFLVGIAYKQFATLVLFYALLYKSKFQPFSQSPISKVQFQTIQMCTEKGFVEKCSSFQRFSTPVFYVSAQIVLSMQYVQCAYNYVV